MDLQNWGKRGYFRRKGKAIWNKRKESVFTVLLSSVAFIIFETELSYVLQAGLELIMCPRLASNWNNPPASAFWVLGLQVCAAISGVTVILVCMVGTCLCVHVWVCVLCMHMDCRRHLLSVLFLFFPFWGRVSLTQSSFICSGCLVSGPGNSPASICPAWGFQVHTATSSFFVGAGIWTQVLLLVQQVITDLSHLPRPCHQIVRGWLIISLSLWERYRCALVCFKKNA